MFNFFRCCLEWEVFCTKMQLKCGVVCIYWKQHTALSWLLGICNAGNFFCCTGYTRKQAQWWYNVRSQLYTHNTLGNDRCFFLYFLPVLIFFLWSLFFGSCDVLKTILPVIFLGIWHFSKLDLAINAHMNCHLFAIFF